MRLAKRLQKKKNIPSRPLPRRHWFSDIQSSIPIGSRQRPMMEGPRGQGNNPSYKHYSENDYRGVERGEANGAGETFTRGRLGVRRFLCPRFHSQTSFKGVGVTHSHHISPTVSPLHLF